MGDKDNTFNALAVVIVCIAFAILLQGGAYIQIAMEVPEAVAQIVQGLILFFVLGSEFFIQYKVTFRNGKVAVDRKSVV